MVITKKSGGGPKNTEIFYGVPHSVGGDISEKVVIMEDTGILNSSSTESQNLRAELRMIYDRKRDAEGIASLSAIVDISKSEVLSFRDREKSSDPGRTTIADSTFSVPITAVEVDGHVAVKKMNLPDGIRGSLKKHGIKTV